VADNTPVATVRRGLTTFDPIRRTPSGPPAARSVAPAGAVPSASDQIGAVEEELAWFVAAECAALTSLDPALEMLASAARDAVLGGGKRIRPLFAYWGWRASGGAAPDAAVLPALASLELLHAFALVHDDVMDRSDTRRGRPSAHRALAGRHEAEGLAGDPARFGDAMAVLVGDLCLVWADRLMSRADVPPDALLTARRAYDGMRIEAIAGQFLDILGEHAPVWTVDRGLRTARLKTASYTVIRPLHFGAGLAGLPDPAVTAAFTRYGVAVGEAFQLRDDLLGAFGEPAITGKPVGDDLVQGKPTVLFQLARARATPRQLSEIDYLTGPGAARPDAAVRLTGLVHATGAPDIVQQMIELRVADGQRALAAGIDETAREALGRLAETMTHRAA
jgi:geranylgeranyl diphosphate synthase, type I